FATARGSCARTVMDWIATLFPEPPRPHSTTGNYHGWETPPITPSGSVERPSVSSPGVASVLPAPSLPPRHRPMVIGAAVAAGPGISAAIYSWSPGSPEEPGARDAAATIAALDPPPIVITATPAAPVAVKPAAANPLEAKPAEAKPAEAKPAAAKPALVGRL